MTAPPITSATGAHTGHTGTKASARHRVSVQEWSHEVAAASVPGAPATKLPDEANKNLKPGHAKASTRSGSASTTNPAQNAHRSGAAMPASGSRPGHHQNGDSPSGAAAMVNLALAAAPVLDAKTSAGNTKTEMPSHNAAPRQSNPETFLGAATPAGSGPAPGQNSNPLTGAKNPSTASAPKPSLPTNGQFNTAKTPSPSGPPPVPATPSTNTNPNRNFSPATAAPPEAARNTVANAKQAYAMASAKSLVAAAPQSTAPQAPSNQPPATPPSTMPAAGPIAMPSPQTTQPANPAALPAGQTVPATPSALAATIVAMQKNGDSTTTLHLNPAGLGQLTVHVSMAEGSHINVQFLPATPQAAHILNNNLDDLRQAMTAAGLSPGQTFVGGDNQNNGSGNNPPPQQGRQYSQTRAAPTDSTSPNETTQTGFSAYA